MDDNQLPPTLADALKKFITWSDQRQDDADAKDRVTSPLYHYTNLTGLTGILSHEEIWLTSIFNLNDPSEYVYGKQLAIDEFDLQIGEFDLQLTARHSDVLRSMSEVMRKVLTKAVPEKFGFFVACFSSAGDDLGQWRAYGDDGRGVSLGLASTLFQRDPPNKACVDLPPNETIIVAKVIYNEEEALNRQRDVIAYALNIVRSLANTGQLESDETRIPFLEQMCSLLATAIIFNCITSKHPAYQSEQETRIILINEKEKLRRYIKTRIRGSELIPFVPHKMPLKTNLAIASIAVGPSAHKGAEDGLGSFLVSQGILEKDLVVRSTIPYRSH